MKSFRQCAAAVAMCGVAFGLLAGSANAQATYLLSPDSKPQPGVPQGQLFPLKFTSEKYYPGASCTVLVYVPAEYDGTKPACLCVGYDGPGENARTVFDNLIYKKQMPVLIGAWITPSGIDDPNHPKRRIRNIRSYEYDSTNADYGNYVIHEVMPWLEQQKTPDGKPILISSDPNDHMAMGGSTGGIGSFTIAWEHPEFVRRVFSAIGTFVGMRGGDMYPTLVRKTEPKPIRVFLQDGAKDTWNPAFDDWFQQNQSMEEALRFAGYDVNHSWGVLGHEGSDAASVFPEAVKWLWRDYPQPIVPGVSGNSWLKQSIVPGQGWNEVSVPVEPAVVASDPTGAVYFADRKGVVYKLDATGKASRYADFGAPLTSLAFDKEGALYASLPEQQEILKAAAAGGKVTTALTGVRASHVIVDSAGRLYVSEPGLHDEMPSSVWLIDNGAKKLIDSGIRDATGLLITPDRSRFLIAEGHTHWVFDSILQPDGTIQDREHFYWLHDEESTTDGDWADAGDMAMDKTGDLYVATRMGVQIGDTEGRVAGILTLPGGKVSSLCYGGAAFDTLYAVCGGKLYERTMANGTVPNFVDISAAAPAAAK